MINVQHGETGRDGIGRDALAVLERGGMRDDDGQATFEGLLAVVVVLGSWVERSDTTADVRHFGTVDELVPDFGSARLWRAFADAFLITNHISQKLYRLNKFYLGMRTLLDGYPPNLADANEPSAMSAY